MFASSSPSSNNLQRLELPPAHEPIEKAFGWSDMPPEGDYILDFSTLRSMSRNNSSFPPTSSLNDSPCPAKTHSCASLTEAHNNSANVIKTPSKRVQFAKWMEIRTHEVILGSHPACHLFALECGWRHNGSKLVDFEAKEQRKGQQTKLRQNRSTSDFHLPFEARRKRLLEVTGMTGVELLRLDTSMRESRQLCHSNTMYSLLSELITSMS